MKNYLNIFIYFGLFVFFMVSDIILFYSPGRNHSPIPFIVCSTLMLIVAVIAGMALYQSHKHRNDEEPW